MKKYLMIVTSLACGLHMTCAASAANLSPYQYNPKQPPVEIDLSALDEVEAQQKPAAAAPAGNAEVSQPMALTPPAAAPQQEQQPAEEAAETPAASAPADSTEAFLDKIMANHLPPGTKKKTVKAPASVTPPAPVRKPAVPAAVEAPKAAEKPAEAQAAPEAEAPAEAKPAAEPAPADVVEAPKTEEKPAEAQTTPETPAEAKPAEEKPAGPVVRERRRKTSEADAPAQAEMTIAFDKTSSELSPAAQKDLDAVIAKIKDMPDLRIQLRAYATNDDGNPSNARRMSLSRGLMVRSYLTEKGISPSRLDVRALGAEGDAPPSDQVELVFVK
jgi:outer membrane protein OmpA-like peptidoglycan-associated protein